MTDSAGASAAPLSESDDRLWASLAHLGGIVGILPSLIIWLVFKDRGRFTDVEAKEALNFQITLAVTQFVVLVFVGIITVVTFGLGSFLGVLHVVVFAAGVVFSILAFLKVKDGAGYRYPFAVRLIK